MHKSTIYSRKHLLKKQNRKLNYTVSKTETNSSYNYLPTIRNNIGKIYIILENNIGGAANII